MNKIFLLSAALMISLLIYTADITPAFAQRPRKSTGMNTVKNQPVEKPAKPITENIAFKENFLRTAGIITSMRGTLRLTGEQIANTNELVASFKESITSKDQEIENLTVEMNTLAWENPFDIDSINSLAMKRHELVVERDKLIVDAYDQLNSILTDEQKKVFKESRDKI